MGKYEQLQRHLGHLDSDVRVQMTFEEVAQWVPGGLPSSAFRNPRWWANEPIGSQAQAWIQSGWAVSGVDLDSGTVIFERTLDGAAVRNGAPGLPGLDGPGMNGHGPGGDGPADADDATAPVIAPTNVRAMEQLAGFLGGDHVPGLLDDLTTELYGGDAQTADGAAASAGFTPELLSEAFAVRRQLGRLNDLIHAAAMTMALPQILEPDEIVAQPPCLSADGDPAYAFDLETDRRVADFRLAVWTGKDLTRKRALFQGLVHLAAQPADRRPELYVAGAAPLRFLRNSQSNVAWALNRGPEATRALFLSEFGDLAMSIRDFTEGPAAHVKLVDLGALLPPMQSALSA